MENKELLGIGKTWLFAVIVFITTSILFGLDKVTVDVWTQMTTVALSVGGGKSAIVGAAKLIAKKE